MTERAGPRGTPGLDWGVVWSFRSARERLQRGGGPDLVRELRQGRAVAIYSTAGLSRRMGPISLVERGLKSGVELPMTGVDGRLRPFDVLEAVILATAPLARTRGGRLSVFHGDQVMIPGRETGLEDRCHLELFCTEQELAVASSQSQDGTEEEVRAFQRDFRSSPFRTTLLCLPVAGKADALKVIATHARSRGCTVLAFADDDVVLPPGALIACVQRLLTAGDLVVVGSEYQPLPPRAFWERVFAVGGRHRNPPTLLCGRFIVLDAQAYPMIPSHLIADDLYLTAYFLDVGAADPLRRVVVNHDTVVQYRFLSRLGPLLRRFERVLLGWEQVLELAPASTAAVLRAQLTGSTWLGGLGGRGLPAGRESGYRFLFASLMRLLQVKVAGELLLRRCLGLPKGRYHW